MRNFLYWGHKPRGEELFRFFETVAPEGPAGLIAAAARGDFLTVTVLMIRGVDVRAHDDEALLWASYMGHSEMVSFLLVAGADAKTNPESIAWAAAYGETDIVKV
jgi:hypothetical protein